ncbi:helix-turn-helix domain-containing protein [Luteolibacter algae]|uniref:Helix-turn-helix domain-containing protein n=1 Tax=Luteolibacter algae TaxID=454151 RepID=A0ABW5D746_9BACT
MNRISTQLLRISISLEEAGLKAHASELVTIAERIAKDDRLLTVAEAAAWLGCGRRTLDQMISERRIPAHLIGGRYRFDKLEILRETKLGR